MKLLVRILCLMCMIILSDHAAKAQTANFTADYTAGCSPLVVHFTNTSTGATTYDWNLGNGVTSTSNNVSTSYTTPGTYTVTLIAHNGSSTSTHTMVITVYPSPTVSFTASTYSVCPGSNVTFTSTSVGGVPGAMTYLWNFGDGFQSTSQTPTHAYATSGTYNVTLSVTNAQGCTSSVTQTAYIHVYTVPTVNFGAIPTIFCFAPATATFTDATNGTGPFTYFWLFGDGGNSTLQNPAHTYNSTGNYTVQLIVTDANGCQNSLTQTSYITIGHPTAAFTGPTSACVNNAVTFTNTSSAHTSSAWDFGDGGTSPANNGVHAYSTAGTYNVRLVIYNNGCYDTVFHQIVINPLPNVSFAVNPLYPCPAPITQTFTGSVPAGSTVTWSYGDGGTGSGATTTHNYANNGVDSVKMYVTDLNGCTNMALKVDTIYDLIFHMIDTPTSGCVPLTVNFGSLTQTTIPFLPLHPYPYMTGNFQWNFGDGSPISTQGAPTHTYTAVGIYTVVLTAVTANGCQVTDTDKIYVGTPPTVAFTATPLHVCVHRDVMFTATHTGNITDYVWNFGDGSATVDSFGNTTHDYSIPGLYTVTLTGYYNGCPSVPFVRTDYIVVDSPAALFNFHYTCVPQTQVVFTNNSMGATSFLWIFGDNTTNSTIVSPTHSYPAVASYNVELATYNAASGCRDTARATVNLARPTPTFAANDTTICVSQSAIFTPTVTGGAASQYSWYVDNVFIEDTLAVFNYTFNVPGLHTIRLVIFDDHGCLDTVTRTNYMTVAKPVASFLAAPVSGCAPLIVNFTDQSTDVVGTNFTNFTWNFGDGATGSVGSPTTSHTYTAAGTFSVEEIVTDNIGCKDTVDRPSLITTQHATASFYSSSNFPCVGQPITFTNTSPNVVTALWYFGDGGTSTAISPIHAYSAGGTYTVTLTIIDAAGCRDTARYLNYETVTQPHAAFTASDTFSICPPLQVLFSNTSAGASNYSWTFGDGNSSVAFSPSDIYIAIGYYPVTLVATDANGCKDSVTKHVNIFGYTGAFTYAPLTGCAPWTVNFTANISNVPSIVWDFADGSTSSASSSTTTTHVYTIPGAYIPRLILSDNTGCQNSSQGVDTIKVDKVTGGFTTSPVCLGSTVQFTDTSTSYWSTVGTWNWTFDNGTITTSTLNNPSFFANAVGTYTVTETATDAWGCAATIVKEVTIYPLPVIDAGNDTIVCVSDYATLVGTGGVSYVWSPAATLSCTDCNPTHATPVVPTTYTVIGTDVHGCVNTDTVNVGLKTKTVSVAGPGGEICSRSPFQLHDSGATTYTWIPAAWLSDPHSADPVANPVATITYTVIAQLGSCIPDTNFVTVITHPVPTVDAGQDQTLQAGSLAQLNATGSYIYKYLWDNGATLNCDTCASPVASMTQTTTYIIAVTSDFGCTATDSVKIYLYCDDKQLFIPNTFTPNGDGQNDVFYPRGTGVKIINSFRIYNRWGQLMFERTNISPNDESNAWDGSFGGEKPRPDVYVYMVDAVCSTGQPLFIKGDVTIIR